MSLRFYLCDAETGRVLFERQITHNLGPMAEKVGLYGVLWHSDGTSSDGKSYKQYRTALAMKNVLHDGLTLLKSKPDYFKTFDAENGWGLYGHFVKFVEAVKEACLKYPYGIPSSER